jgi:hypothetical protein
VAGFVTLAAPTAQAVDVPAPSAHYDMSHDGATLIDISGNGYDATLVGLTDASFVSLGDVTAVRFQEDGYATLPQGPVTSRDNDFTVAYTVTGTVAQNQFGWVIGDGFGAWNTYQLGDYVFVNPVSSESGYVNQVLSGIRVKRDSGNGEIRLPAGGGLNSGFTTLTLVGSGDILSLYRDGTLMSTVTHPYVMADIVPSGDILGYLGRSLYTPDSLLDADVLDVAFWDVALSAEQVGAAMPSSEVKAAASEALACLDDAAACPTEPTPAADLDAIVLAERTTENLPLTVTGPLYGSAITWASSDPSLVTATDPAYAAPTVGAADPFAGGGLVSRPAYGEGDRHVTLTATATLAGETAERVFEITVAEHARWAPDAGYAAAYFKSDSDERIYQAATEGNDFFTFTPVNGGEPTIVSTADERGLRDPYILRSHDGDKYYMVATDLCIGCGTGWGPAQSNGSLKIEVWESTDLVTWTRTNGENTGIVINQPEAGMTWAPEAYWDDSLQSYVVFFASRLYADATHSNSDNLYARMFYVLTRDFRTFTYPPTTWQDTGHARIDSTVTKIGDYYYRFTKNENGDGADGLEVGKDIFLERSAVLTAATTRSDWSADPALTWQLTDTNMTTGETGQAGEGPQIVKLNEGDPNNTPDDDGYVFLVDNYGAGGYRAFVTTGEEITSSTETDRISRRAEWEVLPVGGLPASPRHGSFVSVSAQVLDALHAWAPIEPVASTIALDRVGDLMTATVTAADGGQVAGTVTFASGDWSATATLNDLGAVVQVPASVDPDTIVASYDGYDDGLVAPVATQPPALALTATATTRCVAGKVVDVVTVTNADTIAAQTTVALADGTRAVTVEPGQSASTTFMTRAAESTAQLVTLTAEAADGRTGAVEVTTSSASCG